MIINQIYNPGAHTITDIYDESFHINFYEFGGGVAGNINQQDGFGDTVSETILNLIDVDNNAMIVDIECTDAGSLIISSSMLDDFTTNFIAGFYERGFKSINTDPIAFNITSLPVDTPMQFYFALGYGSGGFSGIGDIVITDGASTSSTSITIAEKQVGQELGPIEVVANSSGEALITLTADAGATNEIMIGGMYVRYVK